MFHDTTLAAQAKADPRPKSAVSTGVGIAGMAGMLTWTAIAFWLRMDGPWSALLNVAATGIPMILWSLFVDKVHRNPSTGIDWSNVRPWRETIDVSLTKIAGLWFTWGCIATVYAIGRFYWEDGYAFSMWCFMCAAPVLFLGSIPWVIWMDRRLKEPRDGSWAMGAWLLNVDEPWDKETLYNHLRSWAVKGFFLAFMLAIVPPNFGDFINGDANRLLHDPVALAQWLISLMFVIDVAFATAGYILTFRVLDAHIRTATPLAAGWTAALICYPPFGLTGDGGPLGYTPGSSDYTHWLAGHPTLMAVWAFLLVALTAIYAWATVAFGLRFSNLTHRGILTHGPYRFSRHPAYLSKNSFWFLSTLPFFTTTSSWTDAARNTALMGIIAGVYYWRAKTEEKHLGMDPAYREYSEWMDRNGPVPRVFAWVTGRRVPAQAGTLGQTPTRP